MGRKGVEVGQTNPSKNARSRLHRMLTIQSRQFFYSPFLSTSPQLWLVRSPWNERKTSKGNSVWLGELKKYLVWDPLLQSGYAELMFPAIRVFLADYDFQVMGGNCSSPPDPRPPSPTSRTSCHHPSSGLLWGEMSHTESSTIIALCTCSLRYSTPLTPSTSSSSSSYSLLAFVGHLVGRGVNCLWIEWILLIF